MGKREFNKQEPEKDFKKLDYKVGEFEREVEGEVKEIKGEIEKIDEKIGLKTEKVAEKSDQKIEKVDQKVEDVKTDVKEIKSDVRDLSRATKTLFKIFTRSHDYLLNHYIWYYNWHTNKASSPTHWAALLLTIVLLVYIFGFQLGFFGGQKPVIYAGAGINKMLNYQGKLTDNNDIPVADGNYDMIFSIYAAAGPGGTPLWTCNGTVDVPAAESVAVANGIFSVGLGDAASGGDCDIALDTIDFNSDTYYLGVTVGLDAEMAPRKRLGAAGYAYNADAVDGIHASSTATANQLLALTASSQISGITELILADGATRYINIDDAVADTGDNLEVYAGNADQESLLDLNGGDLLLYGGSGVNAGTHGNMILSYAGGGPRGQVYVGTNTGSEMLTVGGNVAAADLTLTGGDLFASTATTFNVFNTVATTVNAFGAAAIIGLGAASGTITLGSNSTINGGSADNDDITIQGTSSATRTTSYVNLQPTAGNVGIGTTSPYSQLEVANSSGGQIELTDAGGGQRYSLLLQAPTSAQQYGQILSWKYGTGAGAKDLVLQGSGGKVGIGKTGPVFNLEVTGDNASTWGVPSIAVTDSTNAFVMTIADAAADNGIFWDSNRDLRFGTAGSTVADPDSTYSEKMRITTGGNVGIGTATIPHGGVGYAKFAIEGTDSNAAGPHIQYTTASDDYPLFQQMNWKHDDISLNFDSYYDGAWKSSDAGSNFQIDKYGDALKFRYDSGIAAGSVLTWNDGIILNTSGQVTISNLGTAANSIDVGATAAGILGTFSSSIVYKDNVQDLNLGLEAVEQLRPVSFNWKEDGTADLGFIAEEIEQIDPLLATYYNGELRGVKYKQMTAVLAKAIQEQQAEITNLQNNINLLQSSLEENITINNLEVKDKMITQDIEIKGHIIGSHDTRGVITIPAGKTEMEFVFDSPYLFEPSVLATQKIFCVEKNEGKICGAITDGNYAVEVYQDKFILHIQNSYNYDLTFNWQAQQ